MSLFVSLSLFIQLRNSGGLIPPFMDAAQFVPKSPQQTPFNGGPSAPFTCIPCFRPDSSGLHSAPKVKVSRTCWPLCKGFQEWVPLYCRIALLFTVTEVLGSEDTGSRCKNTQPVQAPSGWEMFVLHFSVISSKSNMVRVIVNFPEQRNASRLCFDWSGCG